MWVTLTVHLITKHKKADSVVTEAATEGGLYKYLFLKTSQYSQEKAYFEKHVGNTRIQDPDVSAIISAAVIIKWFVFKYLINFTVIDSRV